MNVFVTCNYITSDRTLMSTCKFDNFKFDMYPENVPNTKLT